LEAQEKHFTAILKRPDDDARSISGKKGRTNKGVDSKKKGKKGKNSWKKGGALHLKPSLF
jgi:hypothetical protein